MDQILDEFEEAWRKAGTPRFESFENRLSAQDYEEAVSELIQIDLEHRWKSIGTQKRTSLEDYRALLRFPLSEDTQVAVLCREFGIRNRWGDCIGRREICLKYPALEKQFLRQVDREIRDIARWPKVQLLINGEMLVSVLLDRPVFAGRQKNDEQPPFSVRTSAFTHQLNLCEMMDPSVSREQLTISLTHPGTVRIENTSTNRALVIRGRGALEAGADIDVRLRRSLAVSLGGGRYLMIDPPSV